MFRNVLIINTLRDQYGFSRRHPAKSFHPEKDETGLIPQAVKANTIPENFGIGGPWGKEFQHSEFNPGG